MDKHEMYRLLLDEKKHGPLAGLSSTASIQEGARFFWKRLIWRSLLTLREEEKRILHHYTTLDALFNGILVKDPKEHEEISLIATNYNYFNDPHEIDYSVKLIATSDLSPFGLKAEDRSNLKNINSIKNSDILGTDQYVMCFSAADDCLPMWSMYGQNGKGISLNFDAVELSKQLFPTFPCLYTDEQIKKFIKAFTMNVDWEIIPDEQKKSLNGLVNSILLKALKNPAYIYEKEFRYVTNAKDLPINYTLKGNLLVPYVKRYLSKSTLQSITIGPNLDSERVKSSLENYLKYMGFEHVKVLISNVPYRS